MAMISAIEPAAAPMGANRREANEQRASVEYGGAVTHRDKVREKLRVDPVALAEKTLAGRKTSGAEPPRAPADDSYDGERSAPKGQLVDIDA